MEECVGGGARPDNPPAGALEEPGGGSRLGAGPLARCAELAAGNWLSVGGRDDDEGVGRGGGGIMALADGLAGGGGSVEREKLGGGEERVAG